MKNWVRLNLPYLALLAATVFVLSRSMASICGTDGVYGGPAAAASKISRVETVIYPKGESSYILSPLFHWNRGIEVRFLSERIVLLVAGAHVVPGVDREVEVAAVIVTEYGDSKKLHARARIWNSKTGEYGPRAVFLDFDSSMVRPFPAYSFQRLASGEWRVTETHVSGSVRVLDLQTGRVVP